MGFARAPPRGERYTVNLESLPWRSMRAGHRTVVSGLKRLPVTRDGRDKINEREERMLRYLLIRSGLAGLLLVLAAGAAAAQEYTARLSGFSELGALNAETGAILTNGTGRLQLDVDQNHATYTLTYSGLTSSVLQSHLHFAKVHVPGGFMLSSARTWVTVRPERQPAPTQAEP